MMSRDKGARMWCFSMEVEGTVRLQVLSRFPTHFRLRIILIIEDPMESEKCTTAIIVLFIYINFCLRVRYDSLLCSFTSTSFLTNLKLDLNKLYG